MDQSRFLANASFDIYSIKMFKFQGATKDSQVLFEMF
jgi:hypothetical protein